MLRSHAVAILSEIRKKVEAGVLSKAEAEKLAVLALQEVKEAEPEQPAPQEPAELDDGQEEPSSESSETDAIDPKSRILAALTKLEQDLAPAFKAFQEEITALLKETKDAAVPLGEFTIGAEELNAKVAIAQKDQKSVVCTYNFKQDWTVEELELPLPVVANTNEDACHLGLRRELLAVAEDILDNTQSSLSWNRYSIPRDKLTSLAKTAKEVSDRRVLEATSKLSPHASLKVWENWALATVTQILGSDYIKAEGPRV